MHITSKFVKFGSPRKKFDLYGTALKINYDRLSSNQKYIEMTINRNVTKILFLRYVFSKIDLPVVTHASVNQPLTLNPLAWLKVVRLAQACLVVDSPTALYKVERRSSTSVSISASL